MAIDGVPFQSLQHARLFKRRMSKEWIAKVKKEEDSKSTYWIYELPDEQLIAGDEMFDTLSDVAARKKKNFDARPYITKFVRKILADKGVMNGDDPVQAVNIVREVVGLKPIKEKNVEESQNKLSKPDWVRTSLGSKYTFELIDAGYWSKSSSSAPYAYIVNAEIEDAKHRTVFSKTLEKRSNGITYYPKLKQGRIIRPDELTKVLKKSKHAEEIGFIRASFWQKGRAGSWIRFRFKPHGAPQRLKLRRAKKNKV